MLEFFHTADDAPAKQPQRIALIVGNAHYRNSDTLQNAAGDAEAIAAKLASQQFDIIKVIDADRDLLLLRIKQFQAMLALGAIGVFYYSGHGMQIDGQDYLVPTDATFEAPDSNSRDIVYINPARVRGAINISEILKPVDTIIERHPKNSGSLIIYATASGGRAWDTVNGQPHSPFATELLAALDQADLEVVDVFRYLCKKVPERTRGTQIPWMALSTDARFYFNRPDLDSSIGILKILLLDTCRDNPLRPALTPEEVEELNRMRGSSRRRR
ncbi:MAG: caspase family protein [Acidobacteriia bacterium]|nr:caspase family protein [Terriglobia bacterium]